MVVTYPWRTETKKAQNLYPWRTQQATPTQPPPQGEEQGWVMPGMGLIEQPTTPKPPLVTPEFGKIEGLETLSEKLQRVEQEKTRIASSIPITDESRQAITLNLFPTDVGLDQSVQRSLFNVSYEGDRVVDWKPRPGLEDLKPTELSFSVDPTTGDILVISGNQIVGEADKETGELTLDDKFISDTRSQYMKAYGAELPTYTWFTGQPIQINNKLQELFYKKPVIGETILPAPAEVLGIIGTIGALALMGYQAWPVVKNAVSSGTRNILDAFIKGHSKNILILSDRGTAGKLTATKDKLLYNIYKFHGSYIARRAAEIHRAIKSPEAVRAAAEATYRPPQQILRLESGIRTSTQTTNNVIKAVKTGKELTTTSLKSLIATGTPTEFVSGITAVVEGIPMPTGVQVEFLARAETWLQQVPQVRPNSLHTVGVAEGEAFIRTDTEGNPLVAGVSHMREGQLTLSTIVAKPEAEIGVAKALIEVGNYLKSEGIAFPPRSEMSPEAIRVYDKLVAKGEVPEYAPTVAMAEWDSITGKLPATPEEAEALLVGFDEKVAAYTEWYQKEILKPEVENLPHPADIKKFGTALQVYAKATPTGRTLQLERLRVIAERIRKDIPTEVTPEAVKPTAIAEEITAPVTPEVTPEVTFLEAMARWQKMSSAERQPIALKANMPSTLALKDWQALTVVERDAIANAMPRITEKLAKPKAEVTPEVTKPTVEPTKANIPKLRQSIWATAKTKGLSDKATRDIFERVSGSRKLTGVEPKLKADILQRIFMAVQKTRPVKIGAKNVIKLKTEQNIQSLKTQLIADGSLTEDAFNNLVEELKLSALGYESKESFITEVQGRGLLRAMNDEAEVGIVGWNAKAETALEGNSKVKAVIGENNLRLAKAGRVYFDGKPIKVTEWADMRFVMDDLQTQSGGQFYDVYFRMLRQSNYNRERYNALKRAQVKSIGKTAFGKIIRDPKALRRVNDYIASKNNWMEVKSPKDITHDEIRLANALEDELFEFRPEYRYHRFLEKYKELNGDAKKISTEIPDAPLKDIKEAIDIYESQGTNALRNYLDGKSWGIIGSGFEPHIIVNPRLVLRKTKALFASSRWKAREGVEFNPMDIDVIRRVDRYSQQMLNYDLKPYVRRLESIFQDNRGKFKTPGQVGNNLALMTNLFLGYRETTPMGRFMMKIASQAYITVFGTLPVLPFRNLFQNMALDPNKFCMIDARNRKLTDWDWQFYHTHISQMESTVRDLLLAEGGGLPGLRRINNFILKLNLYGASDSKINRVVNYWGHLNEAERALKQYRKDGDVKKFISNSGMAELTLRQQNYILQNLVMDNVAVTGLTNTEGGYAAISETAVEIVNNVHFLYDRKQRAFIEMGEMGQMAGSLLVFPRSMLQRTWWQIKPLNPKADVPLSKRKQAFKVLLFMLWGSIVANYLFKKATGRKGEPYNPLNVLSWTPGGLAIGSIMDLTTVVGDIYYAARGDENAKGRLATSLTNAGDTFIPFYKITIQALETALEKKQIDRLAYREVRAIIDKKLWELGFLDKTEEGLYQPNRAYYEAERSWEWRIKHALFGTEEEEIPIKTSVSNLRDAQKQLGELIDADDSDDSYIYQMVDFAGDIRENTYYIQPEDITEENGFDPIVVMYNEADTMWEEHYYSLPASQREKFIQTDKPLNVEVGAYLVLWGKLKATGWASGNPETIALVEQLMGQYNIPPDAVSSMGEGKEQEVEQPSGTYPWQQEPSGTQPPQEPSGNNLYPWRTGGVGMATPDLQAQMGIPEIPTISGVPQFAPEEVGLAGMKVSKTEQAFQVAQKNYMAPAEEYILKPNEYVSDAKTATAKELQYAAVGLTRAQYGQLIEQFKQYQIERGNYDELVRNMSMLAKYGYAESVEQAIISELGDEMGIVWLGLPSVWAHALVDRYTGYTRYGGGTQAAAENVTRPSHEERISR